MEKPSLVIAANDDGASRTERGAARIDASLPIDDVSDREDRIDRIALEMPQRGQQRFVLGMNVPEDPDTTDGRVVHGARLSLADVSRERATAQPTHSPSAA